MIENAGSKEELEAEVDRVWQAIAGNGVSSLDTATPADYFPGQLELLQLTRCVVANIPDDLRYTEEHEYVRKSADGVAEVGITDYAQGELGDVVYVELPSVGTKLGKHDVFGTIEAVKAVSELFSPVAGEVVAVNSRLDRSRRS